MNEPTLPVSPVQPGLRSYNTGIIDHLIGMPTRMTRYPWPADCHVQGGGNGIVFESGSMEAALTDPAKAADAVVAALGGPAKSRHYRTAFFEAFPRNPDTFLRGEGATIEEAEDEAWAQFQKARSCITHEFERGKYRTGAGICRLCGMFSSTAFATTLEPCVVCGRDDNHASYGVDRLNRWHCEKCFRVIPEENKSDMHKQADRWRKEDAEEEAKS